MYPALVQGTYEILDRDGSVRRTVAIEGGQVAQLDLRGPRGPAGRDRAGSDHHRSGTRSRGNDHDRSAAAIDAITTAAALRAIVEFDADLSPGSPSPAGSVLDPVVRDRRHR